ncbi:hypothetical protein QUF63_04855 [Anaerolineales bacterium HSG25]|nr:hypothetical protein [Anaerolineales bacterium HSG25]
MIITRERLKAEIDKLPEQYFEVLYRIIQALKNPLEQIVMPFQQSPENTATSERVDDNQTTPTNTNDELSSEEMTRWMDDLSQRHPFATMSKEEVLKQLRKTREMVYEELYGDVYAD